MSTSASLWPVALRGAAVILLLTAAAIALTEVLLRPPARDLLLLALFLPFSGCLSLALGLAAVSVYQRGWLRGMRGKLLATIVLAAGLVMLNVGFTAYLMFLSPHDLELLGVLLAFSMGLSTFFAFVVSELFRSGLALLLDGVRRMGTGELGTRVQVRSGDELEDLAAAINRMAASLDEASQRRQELEDARRHLIGAVSHDLRTPLATMRAMIESINDGVVSDGETVARYHRTMQAEIAYLSRLIDDLFELSQIDAGLLQLRPESSTIGELVFETLEALRPQAEQRRLTLQGECDNALPSVFIDLPRMQRVLYNLVQNALRHTPPDGTVFIRAMDAGNEIAVSVQDNGEGIEAEDLPHIFDRFYRGNKARQRDEAGSGLGLTIARSLVELHGGRIWAESEKGAGARFVFTVPKLPQTAGMAR